MSRLSRDKKREHKRAERSAAPAAAPIDVHVPVAGPGTGAASVGGVPVATAPGEEIQQAVLAHLHRVALATGHPVLATIHDERIGYVVPLRVAPDGSSEFTADPVRMGLPFEQRGSGEPGVTGRPREAGEAPAEAGRRGLGGPSDSPGAHSVPAPQPAQPGVPGTSGPAWASAASGPPEAGATSGPYGTAEPSASSEPRPPAGTPGAPEPSAASWPPAAAEPQQPGRDRPTHVMRPVSEDGQDAAPTFPLRAVPEPSSGGAAPTFRLQALPEPGDAPQPGTPPGTPPGTVAPPMGEFGPPPVMDAPAERVLEPGAVPAPGLEREPEPAPEIASGPVFERGPAPEPVPATRPVSEPAPAPRPVPEPTPVPEPQSAPAPQAPPAPPADRTPAPAPAPASAPAPAPASTPADPAPEDPKPTPARGFDAVAEAVLGGDTLTVPGDSTTPALLAGPMERINEAVKAGRTETAAELAEQTVTEASGTLGPEHPEVLRLRELTAYIAYLAGDPVRSFQLSLDLVRIRRDTRDPEAAYGNIQSAATAWRAVRDPLRGLDLGRDLIGLWTELTAEDGPAADDIEQLESARTRMDRLADRAARTSDRPSTS